MNSGRAGRGGRTVLNRAENVTGMVRKILVEKAICSAEASSVQ